MEAYNRVFEEKDLRPNPVVSFYSPLVEPGYSCVSRRTGSGFLVGSESDEERAVPAGGRHGGARFRTDGPTFHRTPQLICQVVVCI